MKLLRDIPTRHFVAIDIETVRIVERYEDLSDEWKSAWEYKNKQSGEVPFFEELSDSWEKTASLYAEFSKVCAVSVTFLSKSEDKLLCKEFFGTEESVLLYQLGEFLNQISGSSKDFRLVGHAAKYFDYPFLCKRYIINSLVIPTLLDTAHLKPWESRNLCTNADIWKMGGTGAGSSLQALCTSLAIPISKVDLVGDEVGNAYYRGEVERIAHYCSLDTIATFNVIRRIKAERIFQFDEVSYLDRKEKSNVAKPVAKKETVAKKTTTKKQVAEKREPEDVLFEKLPILHRILNATEILPETRQELEALLKSKEPAEEDKVNLKKIILSHYQKKSDKVVVKKEKEKEIDEFINGLYEK
jgi:hypothetical protein